MARGAAEAAQGGWARGRSVHLVVPWRARSGVRRDPRASVSLLSAPLGEPDTRRGGAGPNETLPLVPAHAGVLRSRRHGGHLAAVPPHAIRRHPRTLAAAARALRMGGAARPSRAPGNDVLRRGAAVGEGGPSLPQGLSGVGRAPLGPRGRISNYTAGELRELADVPIEIIPYTTSLPDVDSAPAERDGTGPVLFVGRLVERKGVAHLIEAIARLGPTGPPLEIVGEGPERPALEALAQRLGVAQQVMFRGKVAPHELQASYARAAVCVLPSVLDTRGDTEGLGVVLLEAMNHGTPVIASRVGGIPDIVEDGVSGLLVPPGDA